MQPIQLSLFGKARNEENQIPSVKPVSNEVQSPFETISILSEYEKFLTEKVCYAFENYLPNRKIRLNVTETVAPNGGSDTYSHDFSTILSIDDTEVPVRYEHKGRPSSYSEKDMDSLFEDVGVRVMDALYNVKMESSIRSNGKVGVFKGSLDFLINHQSAI